MSKPGPVCSRLNARRSGEVEATEFEELAMVAETAQIADFGKNRQPRARQSERVNGLKYNSSCLSINSFDSIYFIRLPPSAEE
jgi:hypothetical protein